MQQTSIDLTFVEAGSQAQRTHPFRFVHDLASVDELAALWRRLAVACESPFQQFAWTRAAAGAFATRRTLQVIVVEDGDRAAILPLVRRSQGGVGRLEILSGREMFEPMDAVCPDRPSAHALAEVLLSLRTPLLLARLPADSQLVRALRADTYSKRVSLQHAPGSPWLPLDHTWREPEAHFTARRRSYWRRAQRIAESIGPVSFEVVSPTLAALPSLLDLAFQVEAARWNGRARTALLMDEARGAFWRQFAAAACARGVLRLGLLRIGNACAAMHLMVEHGHRLWLLKMGHDPAFARCSPGLLLMIESVRHAAASALVAYEFLGVEEPWLRIWGAHIRPCLTLRVFPASVMGKLQQFAARLVA